MQYSNLIHFPVLKLQSVTTVFVLRGLPIFIYTTILTVLSHFPLFTLNQFTDSVLLLLSSDQL